ncbi:MAG: WGR domain-containing protein [Planktothrix sp. GU0601_MAG3]|nr:MAG: WGR domain-containing protein [Planktothrix sp. GU0601_MAG3]
MPDYGNIILEGRQVRLIKSGYCGNVLSDELREFDSEEAAEAYYHSTIRSYDPYYAPGHINEPIYLEFSDDKSHKFYEVTVNGLTVTFHYGRIGTTGQTDNSTYGSPRKAQVAAQKKINEKLKKGYVLFPKGKPSRSKSSEVALPNQAIVEEITPPVIGGILVTVKPGEDVYWNIVKFRPGSTVEIVAISPNSWFSFNLMAGENFAYHFNPRLSEGQIVQNTKVGNWGPEERLPFPQEMASGKKFTVKIAVEETQLAVYLNDTFLSYYKHRIPPGEINSLRLICSQGSLPVLSVNISEPLAKSI